MSDSNPAVSSTDAPVSDAPVWFVTGCSSGFGRQLCDVVLKHGGRLVATARDVSTLADLPADADRVLVAPLDVTDRASIDAAVAAAKARFGRIDVLVNNAGYGLFGGIEDTPDADVRRQFDVNVHGLLDVTRAVLPTLRAQKSGHILNLSSIAGLVARASTGFYAATKFAVEALSEALRDEVEPLGIKVTLIEPSGFKTDFHGRSLAAPEAEGADYLETAAAGRDRVRGMAGAQAGDARKAVELMWQCVQLPDPPFRLPMGVMAIELLREKLASVAADADRCEPSARSADGEEPLVPLT
ncbi:oxidoreductase [Alienimonas chondri]|uniref:3-phenylpropionate-dihydrodiol/cinnamic acid-dihydrodiol dehydrogenase n=1 Tax=Alienimonas chondri TaxID=2681879 RepID=A0ABX1VNJ5_9PLAN|nr:oxidoreductase [Alienimonas chondri]NNJ27961.1 3-phenylpropionate-dihydrodiol/cinnamic acid-dihydrodiol dehydrogenase [Alienimonas chondri]